MKLPSRTTSEPRHIICPFCESGELVIVGAGFARCDSCGLPLLGSALETLQNIIGLPDVVGAHACECGHPEMRLLPDGVYHCPSCGSEVLPARLIWSSDLLSASGWRSPPSTSKTSTD